MEDKKKEIPVKKDEKEKPKSTGKSSAKVTSKSEQGSSKGEQGSSKGEQGSSKSEQSSKKVPVGDKSGPDADVLKGILAELKSLSKKQSDMSEQMDSQAAHIAHLDDEWNIKTGQGVQKPKLADCDFDDDDSDDEHLATIASSVASENLEDGEVEDEVDQLDEVLLGKQKKGVIPSAEEIEAFKKAIKLSDENGDEDWSNAVKARGAVEYYVGLPGARDFAGQKPDVDVPDLKYKNKKTAEKDMAAVQKVAGAISLAELKLADEVKALVTNANITMGEFADPAVDMLDARQEAAISMENVKETATGMLKTVGAIGKMANYAYSKLLAMRRQQYLDAVDRGRGAQAMVKRLKPSTRYLFGDNIRTVCRTLKEGSQLNAQLQKNFRGGGGARGRGPQARGGFRGFRGFRGKGGKGRGFNKKDG